MMSDDENERQEPAFRVDAACDDFNLEVPPTSGVEYLRRVQLEAKTCPEVVVAHIDRSAYKHRQTVKVTPVGSLLPAPSGYAPSLVWQKKQIADFSRVRQQFNQHLTEKKKAKQEKPATRIPRRDNVQQWCELCFGKLQPRTVRTGPPSAGGSEDGPRPDETAGNPPGGTPPLLSIMTQMDQQTVLRVLEYHINWFEATGFTTEQGRWLYALLACLEKPLTPEACSLLRSLARNCANLRAAIESSEDIRLVSLNLIICLVARYFDQMDLVDSNG